MTTTRQSIAETAHEYYRHAPSAAATVDLEAAACRGEDLELFFSIDDLREQQAKAVCQRCPVRWECLGYALETRQRHGIWGGLNPEERTLLVRKLRQDLTA